MVENFEKEFAAFCHTERAVAVNSGTDALRFALMAAGVKAGDVVVTVPHTFIATTEAISQAGALPEFVDIDERTYNMDPEKLREYLETQCTVSEEGKLISKRSKRPVTAIVPVHLYGQMADMDAILELAEQHRLVVVEDACQAHGAEYFSRKQNRWFQAGSMGRAARLQLLSWEKSGSVRRRWRDYDERCEARGYLQDDPRSRPGEEVLPRHRGIQRPPRFDPDRNPEREIEAPGGLECKATGKSGGVQPSAGGFRSGSPDAI